MPRLSASLVGRCLAVLAAGGTLAGASAAPTPAVAQEALVDTHAVVFMYHRFGDSRYPSTNIRMEQLEKQLDYLEENDFNFVSLPDFADALEAGESLPDRSVVMTVDDSYTSFYETGWPVFEERDIPVALFVSTDTADENRGGYMSWDQIREVQDAGVYIGHHTAAHAHMTKDYDLNEAAADLDRADNSFDRELGEVPDILAYPYGEYSAALKDMVAERGFRLAFGQHSGVAHNEHDMLAQPRFALNETYGDMEDFRLRARTLPLPVSEVIPQDVVVRPDSNPPRVGFTIDEDVANPKNVSCFASGQGEAPAEFLGERRMEVRIDSAFDPPRARVNCTLHAGGGRFRWYGRQFVIHQN